MHACMHTKQTHVHMIKNVHTHKFDKTCMHIILVMDRMVVDCRMCVRAGLDLCVDWIRL